MMAKFRGEISSGDRLITNQEKNKTLIKLAMKIYVQDIAGSLRNSRN
jgi:hypothetical protein